MTAKQSVTQLTDEAEIKILKSLFGDIGAPRLLIGSDGNYWAMSDELRAWRSQNTSASNHEETKAALEDLRPVTSHKPVGEPK